MWGARNIADEVVELIFTGDTKHFASYPDFEVVDANSEVHASIVLFESLSEVESFDKVILFIEFLKSNTGLQAFPENLVVKFAPIMLSKQLITDSVQLLFALLVDDCGAYNRNKRLSSVLRLNDRLRSFILDSFDSMLRRLPSIHLNFVFVNYLDRRLLRRGLRLLGQRRLLGGCCVRSLLGTRRSLHITIRI